MSRLILDISTSLDGYVAGDGISVAAPFGDAGHRLHRWMGFGDTQSTRADDAMAERMLAKVGAVLVGRRMFDVGIDHWGEDGTWERPCLVLTHRRREPLVRGPTTFTFVDGEVDDIVSQAREAAIGKDVLVAGGGDIARQCLAAGLVDEMRLHVVPVLLGRGVRLFEGPLPRRELTLAESIATPHAVHQTYHFA